MDYNQALQYLHNAPQFKGVLNLENMRSLMDILDEPQNKLNCIHIAGTNGKGSTAAFLSSILQEAGYKTGMYTSPYIHKINETIQINGQPINDYDFAELLTEVRTQTEFLPADKKPSEFELTTGLAFLYFQRKKCHMAVIETGVGGRLDATNVIKSPLISVITSIDYDHLKILGKTLEEIAFEKAGIIKPERPLVSWPQSPQVKRVLEAACKEKSSGFIEADFENLSIKETTEALTTFDYKEYKELEISLLGKHQAMNAALAAEAAITLSSLGFNVPEGALRRGLLTAKWPGRFEILHHSPEVIIDGAHNMHGLKTLKENLKLYYPGKKFIMITGVLADKDYRTMMNEMLPLALGFYTVTPDNHRALPANELANYLRQFHNDVTACETAEDAVRNALKNARSQDVICAFGSLYYIGRVRSMFTAYAGTYK